MLTEVPPVLARLVDDAVLFTPGSATLADALHAFRGHRHAWYEPLLGTFLVPASELTQASRAPGDPVEIGVRGELRDVTRLLAALPDALAVRELVVPVAKRGQDPEPGLRALVDFAARLPSARMYAEIPLTWGLVGALDLIAAERAGGLAIAAKFRTGGLAAELFPTPMELAAVIVACRERDLPFKITTGLHQAVRHNDPETGFTHHGFLNVLVATLAAVDGAEVVEVASLLAMLDPYPLVERVRPNLSRPRPLWDGFGANRVEDCLSDLIRLGLVATDEG